jgi:chorismate mutase/prephenate dehydratase
VAAKTTSKPKTPAKPKTAAPAAPAASPEDLERFLSGVRRDIDAIDDAILDLLNRRAAASIEVGRRKSGTSQAVFKPFRKRRS